MTDTLTQTQPWLRFVFDNYGELFPGLAERLRDRRAITEEELEGVRQLLTLGDLRLIAEGLYSLFAVASIGGTHPPAEEFDDLVEFAAAATSAVSVTQIRSISFSSPLEIIVLTSAATAIAGNVLWLFREVTERRREIETLRGSRADNRIKEAKADIAEAVSEFVVRKLHEKSNDAVAVQAALEAMSEHVIAASEALAALTRIEEA